MSNSAIGNKGVCLPRLVDSRTAKVQRNELVLGGLEVEKRGNIILPPVWLPSNDAEGLYSGLVRSQVASMWSQVPRGARFLITVFLACCCG